MTQNPNYPHQRNFAAFLFISCFSSRRLPLNATWEKHSYSENCCYPVPLVAQDFLKPLQKLFILQRELTHVHGCAHIYTYCLVNSPINIFSALVYHTKVYHKISLRERFCSQICGVYFNVSRCTDNAKKLRGPDAISICNNLGFIIE